MPFRRALLPLLGVLLAIGPFFAATALADVVVPGPDVTTRVIVRTSASAQSAQVGSLTPGQQAELTGSVPNWHEVRLSDGTSGFVSKRWTKVVSSGGTAPTSPPGAMAPKNPGPLMPAA